MGSYNKIPQTGQLTNRNLFLTVVQAGSPRLGCHHGQVTALFWVADCRFLAVCVLTWLKWASEFFVALSIKALFPFMWATPS